MGVITIKDILPLYPGMGEKYYFGKFILYLSILYIEYIEYTCL